MRLSPADRDAIESQPFDAGAAIAFHELAGCLVWSDEVPDELTPGGLEYVRDLLGARGYLHRDLPAELGGAGAVAAMERWHEALANGLRWNGFRRLVLTADQRALLERYLADQSEL